MRLLPFRRRRPPTESAVAIAASLAHEPERWELSNVESLLRHDSGILIGTDGYTWRPDLEDEPFSNSEIVSAAISKWIAAKVQLPRQDKGASQ